MGSVQLGLPYGAANRTGKPDRQTALRLVRRAADRGISQFDTARAYGDAEDRLGEALDGRKAIHRITKLSPLNELRPSAHRAEVRAAVDASISQSLAALRVPRLDCLMLHRAQHFTAFHGAVWERLIEHVEEGTVLALGVSVQSPGEALDALARPDIAHIQLPFNLLDWRWSEAGVVSALRERKSVGVHARSVLLQGILAADDVGVWPKIRGVHPAAIMAWSNNVAEELQRENVADLCLAYARAQDWINGVVIGMETAEQLDANLTLAALRPLHADECRYVEATRPRVPETLLDPAKWPPRA